MSIDFIEPLNYSEPLIYVSLLMLIFIFVLILSLSLFMYLREK